MANVYPIGQERIGETLDFENPAANIIKVVALKDNTYTFDKADLDLGAVLTNGGAPLTKSAAAAGDLNFDNLMVVNDVQTGLGGADYSATKHTFTAVATEAAWTCVIIYDATTDTNDTTRLPIAGFTVSITPNGSDIEIRWGGTDGLGVYMTSRNS